MASKTIVEIIHLLLLYIVLEISVRKLCTRFQIAPHPMELKEIAMSRPEGGIKGSEENGKRRRSRRNT